jgi:hypothetical protein
MSDDFKVKVAKFGTRLILKYIGADLIADGAGLLAEIGKDYLPEAVKTLIKAFPDDSMDFLSGEADERIENFLTKKERGVNSHLAKGICRVWQQSLTDSLPKNRAANSKYFLIPQDSFQEYAEQLEFFIEKFQAAQETGNENLLTDLFYDRTKSEEQFYNTFFAGVQNTQTAEDAYWETLQKTLLKWTQTGGKFPAAWENGFPEDFSRELKKFLFENLRLGLKEVFNTNEDFRNTFIFSVNLTVFDLINKMPAEIRENIENAQSENRLYFSRLEKQFYEFEASLDGLHEDIKKAFLAALDPETVNRVDKKTDLILEILEKIAEKQPPPPKPELPIKLIPSTTFPQQTNFFTGRKKVLDDIKTTLYQFKTASLFGLHGLGKTSAAVEYAYRSFDEYDFIIFVLANRNDFFLSLAKCAADVGLPLGENVKDEQKAAGFRLWLEKQKNFLLILDNVDKVEQVKAYLPTPNNGHLLFTSNFSAIKTAGKEVEINEMESAEAELLLYRRAKEISDAKAADIPADELEIIKQIVAEVGFLPLAINISGSYIARKQKTFAQYLELYKKYSNKLLAEYDEADVNYPKSLLTSFSLSYESITKPKDDSKEETFIADATANCLKSCVFMLPDQMPEEILRMSAALLSDSSASFAADDFLWDEVVENLLSYNFFERDAENQTFSTHRLIPKLAVTKINGDEQAVIQRLATSFDSYFPNFDYENKKECERYLLHLEHFLNYLRKDVADPSAETKLDNETTASLFYKLGRYYWFMGNYELTKSLFEISCSLAEKILGEEDNLTLNCYDHLGGVNHFMGNHEEAIKYMLKVIEIKERLAARNKQELDDLDLALPDYNEQRDALEYEVANLKLSKLHTSQKLARVYTFAGKIQEAYDLINGVIKEEMEFYGGLNEEIVNSYIVLAQIFESVSEFEKAEEIYRMIQDFYTANLDADHPLIFENLYSIAMVLKYQSKYTEALTAIKEVYTGLRNYYGDNNSRVTSAKRHLEEIQSLASGNIN